MKFFSISLHIGIADIIRIFQNLGHSIDNISLSDHNHIMGWKDGFVDIINKFNWRSIDAKMCDAFYERYKDELSDYDGFVTFYPPSFSMLFERFNKPIITCVPIRYEIPFYSDVGKWNHFNRYLRKGIDDGQIIPVVNNLYDQIYLKVFTERDWQLISSLCEYTDVQYNGHNNKFLYCSKFEQFKNWIANPNVVSKSQIKGYSWKDIADFKALIYVPYSNTIMSLFEQYYSNIPLLFPSKDFLVQLWKQDWDKGVMSEISFRQVFHMDNNPIMKCDLPDPNDYRNLESFEYWSALSDFYDEENFPHIEHFNSIRDLEYKLFSLDFSVISGRMKEFNVVRKRKIYSQWEKILNKI